MKRFLPWSLCTGVALAGCSLVNDPEPSVEPSVVSSSSSAATSSGGSGGATSSAGGATSAGGNGGTGGAGGAVGTCGDGKIEGAEQCDGGGETADCDVDCTKTACGDGLRNGTAGEKCDDGNLVDGDACNAGCLVTAFDVDKNAASNVSPIYAPDVAVTAFNGKDAFSVAWVRSTLELNRSVFEPTGAPLNVDAPVSIGATSYVRHAENALGHMVAAWPSGGQLFYRVLGNNFSDAVPGAKPSSGPSIAVSGNGNHCLAWVDNYFLDARIRCLDAATSKPIGTSDLVFGAGYQSNFQPVVLLTVTDGLVAWWRDPGGKLFARRMTESGMPLGNNYSLSSPNDQLLDLGHGVALADGSYVAANTFNAQFSFPSPQMRVALTRVNNVDVPLPLAPAIDTVDATESPAFASAGGSDFVLFVTVMNGNGPPCELRAQRYNANSDLQKLGQSFSVAGAKGECALGTRAVANKAGDVMVVWGSQLMTSDPMRIRAAIYPGLVSPKP